MKLPSENFFHHEWTNPVRISYFLTLSLLCQVLTQFCAWSVLNRVVRSVITWLHHVIGRTSRDLDVKYILSQFVSAILLSFFPWTIFSQMFPHHHNTARCVVNVFHVHLTLRRLTTTVHYAYNQHHRGLKKNGSLYAKFVVTNFTRLCTLNVQQKPLITVQSGPSIFILYERYPVWVMQFFTILDEWDWKMYPL